MLRGRGASLIISIEQMRTSEKVLQKFSAFDPGPARQ
jgi:hypothetical protein